MTTGDSAPQLPLPSVHANKNGTYTHTLYKLDDQGRKVQIKRILRIGREMEASKRAIEERKKWAKFGAAKHHGPGPDTETTRVDTELTLRLSTNPQQLDTMEPAAEEASRKLKDTAIKCRYCGGPHWSKECPSKDIIQSLQEATGLGGPGGEDAPSGAPGLGGPGGPSGSGRYVPPSLRDGTGAPRPGMEMGRRMDDTYAVRIANLPEDTTDADLIELARPFGHVVRSYLAKYDDGTCKGFAFVNFATMDMAERAIAKLHGYGYANLILTCEHSKPREPKPM
ncbi:Eukaryotic translation initiation factor 3 subunit G [Allomyces javanicus]|nr:Eukaryotic translation initiation factor 3 subunit G [Allomyces javanicus]